MVKNQIPREWIEWCSDTLTRTDAWVASCTVAYRVAPAAYYSTDKQWTYINVAQRCYIILERICYSSWVTYIWQLMFTKSTTGSSQVQNASKTTLCALRKPSDSGANMLYTRTSCLSTCSNDGKNFHCVIGSADTTSRGAQNTFICHSECATGNKNATSAIKETGSGMASRVRECPVQ